MYRKTLALSKLVLCVLLSFQVVLAGFNKITRLFHKPRQFGRISPVEEGRVTRYWTTNGCSPEAVESLREVQNRCFDIAKIVSDEYRNDPTTAHERWQLFKIFRISFVVERSDPNIMGDEPYLKKTYREVKKACQKGRFFDFITCKDNDSRHYFHLTEYGRSRWPELVLSKMFLDLDSITENEGIDMTKLIMALIIRAIRAESGDYVPGDGGVPPSRLKVWDNHDPIIMYGYDTKFALFDRSTIDLQNPRTFFFSTLHSPAELAFLQERRVPSTERNFTNRAVVPNGWYRIFEQSVYSYPFSFEVEQLPRHTQYNPHRNLKEQDVQTDFDIKKTLFDVLSTDTPGQSFDRRPHDLLDFSGHLRYVIDRHDATPPKQTKDFPNPLFQSDSKIKTTPAPVQDQKD